MALVARMAATTVTASGGGRYVSCGPDDEGAIDIDKANVDTYYGRPPWFEGATHVRLDEEAQSSEAVVLTAVSAKGKDDPNRAWAAASPAGTLSLTIQNPDAFGQIQPGATYRVTIERLRGPRTLRYDPASGLVDGGTNRASA